MFDNTPITLEIIIRDAQKAENTVKHTAGLITKYAKEAQVSLDTMGAALKAAFEKSGVDYPNFDKLINAAVSYAKSLEKVASAQEKVNSKMSDKALMNWGKQLEEAEAMQKRMTQIAPIKPMVDQLDLSGVAGAWGRNVKLMESAIKRLATTMKTDYKSAADMVKAETKGMIDPEVIDAALAKVRASTMSLGDQIRKVFTNIKNIISTAFGTLVAIALFTTLQNIQDFFTSAIQLAKDFQNAMRSLSLTEVLLSKSGMEVTKKDLDDLVKYITEKYKVISKLQATEIVASLSIVKDYGLEQKDLKNLADVITYMQIQARLRGEQINGETVLNRLLDGRANALNQFGINLSDTVVLKQAEEMEMKRVNGEYSKHDILLATIAVAQKGTSDNAKEFIASLGDSRQGLEELNKAAIDNAKIKLGEVFLDVEFGALKAWKAIVDMTSALDAATESGTGFSDGLKRWLGFLFPIVEAFRQLNAVLKGIAALLATGMAGVFTVIKGAMLGKGIMEIMQEAGKTAALVFIDGMSQALATSIGNKDNPVTRWIKAQWKGIMGVDLSTLNEKIAIDTPTGAGAGAGGIDQQAEDIAKAIEKAKNTIDDALADLKFDKVEAKIDLDIKLEDINTKLTRALVDIQTDLDNKIADISASYSNKVADINADARQKQKDANTKAHDDELNDELEYQNKLLDLKERFLMDLDDALHARDARQILRLIKQYKLEKDQAARDYELKKKQRTTDLAQQQRDIEIDRRKRLEDAARERTQQIAQAKADAERKRADAQLAAQRERADAQLDYRHKLEDLQRHFNQKMEALGRNLVQEYNLTIKAAEAIRKVLMAYYGPQGAITAIWLAYAGMLGQIMNAPGSTPTPNIGGPGSGIIGGGTRYAEGGTVFANKPTRAIFGEAGLEMATFTPIGRQGRDVNRVFSNLSGSSGGAGVGGSLKLQVVMSEGLIASIVDSSLDHVTAIFDQVRREKK